VLVIFGIPTERAQQRLNQYALSLLLMDAFANALRYLARSYRQLSLQGRDVEFGFAHFFPSHLASRQTNSTSARRRQT